VAVVAQCYVEGVSTRRVDDVVKQMGIAGISKSQVSDLAKSLDETVCAFRNRPLDAGPYTYIWVDALTQKVSEGGRIVNVAVVVATGVNADGHREILASTSSPPKTVPDGRHSYVVSWLEDCRVWPWSSQTPMPASSMRSPRCYPGPPGKDAGSTSSETFTQGFRRAPSPWWVH
jgi:hypothetical protein